MALDRRKEEARERARQAESEVESSKAVASEALARTQTLEEDVGRKEAEITSLQAALSRTRQDASQDASRLEGAVESSKATIAVAMQRIQVLEEDVGQKRGEFASLQAAMDTTKREASKHVTSLEGEVEVLHANMMKVTQELKAREEQAMRDEESLSTLLKDMDHVREDKEALEQSLRAKDESLSGLHQRVTEVTAELEGVRAILNRTEQRANEYASRLQEEVDVSKAHIMEAAEQAEELKSRENEVRKLTLRLKQTEDRLRVASDQIESSGLAAARSRSEASEHAVAIEKLQAASAQARSLAAAEALEVHSALHEEEMAQLQVALNTISCEKESLERTLHGKDLAVQELRQRIIRLTAELEGVRTTSNKMKQEAAEDAARLREEVERSTSSVAEAATQLNACDTATSKLEQGLEGLREELERLREELEHSNKMVREVSARAEASELALERHRCEAAGFATLAQVAGMMKPLQHEIARKTSELQQKNHDLMSLGAEFEDCKQALEKSRKESAEYISFLESEVDALGGRLDEMMSTLKRTKQKSSESATHPEGQAGPTQANRIEAAEELKLREVQAARYEHRYNQITEMELELKQAQVPLKRTTMREVVAHC